MRMRSIFIRFPLLAVLYIAACQTAPTRAEWAQLADRTFPLRDFVWYTDSFPCPADYAFPVAATFPWKEVQVLLKRQLNADFSWPGSGENAEYPDFRM